MTMFNDESICNICLHQNICKYNSRIKAQPEFLISFKKCPHFLRDQSHTTTATSKDITNVESLHSTNLSTALDNLLDRGSARRISLTQKTDKAFTKNPMVHTPNVSVSSEALIPCSQCGKTFPEDDLYLNPLEANSYLCEDCFNFNNVSENIYD